MDAAAFEYGKIVRHIETNERFRIARSFFDDSVDYETLVPLDAIARPKRFENKAIGEGYYHPRLLIRIKFLIPAA